MTISLLLILLVFSLWAYRKWVLPARELRSVLERIAKGGRRPLVVANRCDFFRKQFIHINHIIDQFEEMEQQIRSEGFSLRAILQSMAEGVIITDPELRIRLANTAMTAMFPSSGALLNRTIMETFQDSALQQAFRNARSGQSIQQGFTLETWLQDKYVKKSFSVNAVPLQPEGTKQIAGVLAVFHDVTEIRALETIRRDLIVNVSHELRTPLSIIKGYVETLLDGAKDDPELSDKFLRIILRHGERLDLLIADLMELSRLESGRAHLHLEKGSLADCSKAVLERLDTRIREGNVRIHLDFPASLPEVNADFHRLDQVFTNLLGNALKFIPCGKGEITLGATAQTDSVQVFIRDNGPGVPLEAQTHLFERFYRVHKDRSRDAGGTGLGLSIVKHIIQLHDGAVWVESRVGEGATFFFQIPIQGPERERIRS